MKKLLALLGLAGVVLGATPALANQALWLQLPITQQERAFTQQYLGNNHGLHTPIPCSYGSTNLIKVSVTGRQTLGGMICFGADFGTTVPAGRYQYRIGGQLREIPDPTPQERQCPWMPGGVCSGNGNW